MVYAYIQWNIIHKERLMPSVATWMGLEMIILSGVT